MNSIIENEQKAKMLDPIFKRGFLAGLKLALSSDKEYIENIIKDMSNV